MFYTQYCLLSLQKYLEQEKESIYEKEYYTRETNKYRR